MARASALGSGEGEVTSVIWRACSGLWSNCSADGASESGQPLPAPIVWSACDAGIAIAAEVGCSIGQKTLSPLQTKNVVATITGTTPSAWFGGYPHPCLCYQSACHSSIEKWDSTRGSPPRCPCRNAAGRERKR